MTNEEFQKTVLEQLRKLNEKVDNLDNGQNLLTRKVDDLENGQKVLTKKVANLENGQNLLIKKVDNLEQEQKEIKVILEELDPKNANKHLELKESIDELRKDLSTVEIVTASNYADIAKLKSIK